MDEKAKINRCKFSMPCFTTIGGVKVDYVCSHMDQTPIDEHDCENCENFKSRYIEYPITVNEIKVDEWDQYTLFHRDEIGHLARVRPCGEEYEGKTYVGIFLGEIPMSTHVSYNNKDGKLTVRPMPNPAIFVPELKKIIFGCESWWSIIKSEDEVKDITDEDINSQWYVQALKAMSADKKAAGDNQ